MISESRRGHLGRLGHDTAGQDLIEYALIAAMVALVVVLGLNTLGAAIQGRYTFVASQLESGAAAPLSPGASGVGSSSSISSGGSGAPSTPAAATGAANGSGGGNGGSGNSGNHAGGGNNGNGRGNGS